MDRRSCDGQKILKYALSHSAGALGMKLAPIKIAAMDHGGERHAIVAGGDCIGGHRREETVDVIGLFAGSEAGKKGLTGAGGRYIIPAHMRHGQIRPNFETPYLAFQEP